MTCAVCDACENGSDDSLRALVRYQARMLDGARSQLFPLQVEIGRLRDRVRELEETIERQNKRLMKGRQAG